MKTQQDLLARTSRHKSPLPSFVDPMALIMPRPEEKVEKTQQVPFERMMPTHSICASSPDGTAIHRKGPTPSFDLMAPFKPSPKEKVEKTQKDLFHEQLRLAA